MSLQQIPGHYVISSPGSVDSATCSAIASAYAESAASSKLDTTAFNSADFYSTSNPSGFIDSAYVDSAVSSKADSSALSSYALSADVSGTVDLVSTQSANWGGSALALSAGPGVKLEKVGDTLVASTDETMLWSGRITSNQTAALSESIANFRSVKVYGYTHNGSAFSWASEVPVQNITIFGVGLGLWSGSNQELDFSRFALSNTTVSALSGTWIAGASMGNATSNVTMVYGINRTAEA